MPLVPMYLTESATIDGTAAGSVTASDAVATYGQISGSFDSRIPPDAQAQYEGFAGRPGLLRAATKRDETAVEYADIGELSGLAMMLSVVSTTDKLLAYAASLVSADVPAVGPATPDVQAPDVLACERYVPADERSARLSKSRVAIRPPALSIAAAQNVVDPGFADPYRGAGAAWLTNSMSVPLAWDAVMTDHATGDRTTDTGSYTIAYVGFIGATAQEWPTLVDSTLYAVPDDNEATRLERLRATGNFPHTDIGAQAEAVDP